MTCSLKILVGYHKPAFLLEDKSTFIPINLGRAVSLLPAKDGDISKDNETWLINNTIGDNTGENISSLNRTFCEMTGVYWAWKNLIELGTPDYIGFMQYRRHFILNDFFENAPCNEEKLAYKVVHFKNVNNVNYQHKIACSKSNFEALLIDYDCILPMKSDLKAINVKGGITSIWDDWVCRIPGVHVDDLILLEDIFGQMHPDARESFSKYLESSKKLMYNMFITSKTIFNEYCSWIFPILFRLNELLDTSCYSLNGKRTLGYLSEILYGCYFTSLENNNYFKIKHLGLSFIDD